MQSEIDLWLVAMTTMEVCRSWQVGSCSQEVGSQEVGSWSWEVGRVGRLVAGRLVVGRRGKRLVAVWRWAVVVRRGAFSVVVRRLVAVGRRAVAVRRQSVGQWHFQGGVREQKLV